MKDRVYPDFLPWNQATGRWSTVKPALSTLPYSYRKLYIPDPDEVWVQFDWSAIEARIFAALSGDAILLEAFREEWDVHITTVCDLFDYNYPSNMCDPHGSIEDEEWRVSISWKGKDDARRVYAKSFLYGLIYGLDPRNASSLPGSDRLGVSKDSLSSKALSWLDKHPAVKKYRKDTERFVLKYSYSTSVYGRRRYLLEFNKHRKIKQALDNPMQATASDIMNDTMISLWRLTKDIGGGLVYPMHDSIKWRLGKEYVEEYLPKIEEVVQVPRKIGGYIMDFPAEFEVIYGYYKLV